MLVLVAKLGWFLFLYSPLDFIKVMLATLNILHFFLLGHFLNASLWLSLSSVC